MWLFSVALAAAAQQGAAAPRLQAPPPNLPLPAVDQFAVTYLTPSESSLGAMPLGNGRTSVNTWVERSTSDLLLSVGLADALDENSNLLKLGLVRVQLDPPLDTSTGFNQTLRLSTATVEIRVDGVALDIWVDANTSTVRVTVTPGDRARTVRAVLDHQRRLDGTVDAGGFGNGWGGSSGSFCYSNGSIASFVGIYPDKLLMPPVDGTIAWYHRNDRTRSDMFGDTMKQQGLADCGPTCWDPLTNRSFGAALVGGSEFYSQNSTAIATSTPSSGPCELAIGVASAQTSTVAQFHTLLRDAATSAREEITSSVHRMRHELWWEQFFNRSWVVVSSEEESSEVAAEAVKTPPESSREDGGLTATDYVRHDGLAGDQLAMITRQGWPWNGKSPGNCTTQFSAPGSASLPLDASSARCVAHASQMCDATPGCVAFALSKAWHDGYFPQLFTDGLPGDPHHSDWVLFVNTSAPPSPPAPPRPPPPPSLPAGFLVSRQYLLMRYMDVCSSGRIGGGVDGHDYFALKYNGGILNSEPVPKEDYRACAYPP